MDLTSLIEFCLKALSVLTLSAAAGVIAVNLRCGFLRPAIAWINALFATSLSAVWRSTVAFSPSPADFWAQEINHGVFAVIGIAFLVLAVAGSRHRAEDDL